VVESDNECNEYWEMTNDGWEVDVEGGGEVRHVRVVPYRLCLYRMNTVARR
jgi:hypothetical protein